MNPESTIANALWTATNLPFYLGFRQNLLCPERVQSGILQNYIRRNRETEFGRAHGFETFRTYEDFSARVPITDYESIKPWIDRIVAGCAQVLTTEPVTRLIPTSGSSGARKLIPFTNGLQREFNPAIGAWLFDLWRQRPTIACGPSYWSITPALNQEQNESTKIPIGFDTDAAYLSGTRRWLADAVMAVPPEVGKIIDLEAFRYITLLLLMRNADLRIISVWHPSFLMLLLDTMRECFGELVCDIRAGRCCYQTEMPTLSLKPDPKRAEQLQAADPKHPPTIWPHLQVVSCWGDAAAEAGCKTLEQLFPTTMVQRKGLLATEAFVTIPFAGQKPVAITSHFFEFIDSRGTIRRVHELSQGEVYEVVVTTSGGLWRYRLGDRVVVDGFCGRCPSLTFVGRYNDISDLCGEKLSEQFVQRSFDELFENAPPPFVMLAPESPDSGPHYTFYVQGDVKENAVGRLETLLRRNPNYAYCRDVGQLKPVEVFKIRGDGYAQYARHMASKGQHLGDIKPVALSRTSGWNFIFESLTLLQ